jgi:hypothetical protein
MTKKTDPNVTITNNGKRETVVVIPSKRLVKVILYRPRCECGCAGNDQFVGTAKCMETDVFNVDLGTNLARIRARRKIVNARAREHNEETREIISHFEQVLDKRTSVRNHILRDFDTLAKEENTLLGRIG